MTAVHWPEKYQPLETAVHVSNELLMAAPAERIWAWLIRATLWLTWYEDAKDVVMKGGSYHDLFPRARFHWKTFGLSIESVVQEFIPRERIGWTGLGFGMDVYHGWVIEPRGSGCYVLPRRTRTAWPLVRSRCWRPIVCTSTTKYGSNV
jgi:hypothetical protein